MIEKYWIITSIIIILLIFLAVVFYMKKKNKDMKTDYRTFLYMGLAWLAIGLPFKNQSLLIMGFVFTVLGLAHKKEWGENAKKWSDLSKEEKVLKGILIAILLILFIVGIVIYLLER